MQYDKEGMNKLISDGRFHDIGDLPSHQIPYAGDFDKLYIRPFELAELQLLSRAAQLDELSPLIRAIDLTISQDINKIAIGDFYYLMLWHRTYSMPATPYIQVWQCNQPYFTHKETKEPLLYSTEVWPDGEALERDYNVTNCDTDNTSVINTSTVSIIELDPNKAPVLDAELDYPRVAILEALSAALADPSTSMLAPFIQWIKGATWADKMQTLNAQPDFTLLGKAMKINKDIQFGLQEDITFSCRKCRVSHTETVKLNAMSFFRY